MYATFNMGTGFCVVVSPADARAALDALAGAGEHPVVAGSVTGRPGRHVSIPQAGLLGRGDVFEAVLTHGGATRLPEPPRDTV
jgi:phosphoribosylformylglycinamidine cyclo-ligase